MPRPESHSDRRAPISVAAVSLLLLLASLGCRPEETIRVYDVPKQAAASPSSNPPSNTPSSSEPTHRMLALVLPGGEQAWFFKLVGKLGEVDPIAEQLAEFYRSVRIGDNGKPAWELPNGWADTPPRGMRLSTITVAGGLEISVIGLPLTGDWDAQLLDNVNRWRTQQLGLPPADAAGLADCTSEAGDAAGGAIVDLRGVYSGGMAAPFAGAASRAGAPQAAPPQGNASRATTSKASQPVPPPPPPPAKLDYDKPEGWVALPATATRLANLTTGEGESAATVRASSWPAAGQMGDPAANVNFWRSSLGLPQIDRDEVLRQATPITVGGEDGVLFRMNEAAGETSNKDKPPRAITATMVKRGARVWFFKMAGPAEAVVAEQENYQEWLASIRFRGGAESGVGDNQEPENKPAEEADDGDR